MRAKSQETHGAVGPFLFRKGKAALISEPSIRLHTTGISNNFMLKKTGFSLSLPQQEVWHRSELELVTPRCLSTKLLPTFSCHLLIKGEQLELLNYNKVKGLFYSNKKGVARESHAFAERAPFIELCGEPHSIAYISLVTSHGAVGWKM